MLDNDDFFNNNILERIRIFNNSIMHITLTINKMYNYYLLLKAEINEGIRRYREEIYRWSARNLCIELCIYEEKIKNMLRYLYNLDDEKTMDNSILFSELNKIARTNPILKDLLISCDNFRKSKSYQEVDKIRNDEVHNKSLLDTYKYFKNLNEGRALVSPSYLIPTGFLYTITQEYLNGIVDVKNKLQIVIDNYETQ